MFLLRLVNKIQRHSGCIYGFMSVYLDISNLSILQRFIILEFVNIAKIYVFGSFIYAPSLGCILYS